MSFAMELLLDPRSLDASEPLFYRARGLAANGSFFVEMRELWSEDRIVGMNQQMFALLG